MNLDLIGVVVLGAHVGERIVHLKGEESRFLHQLVPRDGIQEFRRTGSVGVQVRHVLDGSGQELDLDAIGATFGGQHHLGRLLEGQRTAPAVVLFKGTSLIP